MDIAVIKGSTGLISSEVTWFLAEKGMVVVGVDNDMNKVFSVQRVIVLEITSDG
ncbi:MAG: hypothetical protein ACQ9MH_06000 [Nitrospinales bacterium]